MMDRDKLIIEAVKSGNNTVPKILSWLERNGTPSSQPTVSRSLAELIADQRIRSEGRGRATVYLYDDYHDYFSVPGAHRRAVPYNADLIDQYLPNETKWFSPQQLKEMVEVGGGAEMDASTYSRAIAQKLLVDLAYASSNLEGNTYSYIDTEVLVQYGKVAEGKESNETLMILNHKAAINYLIDYIEDIEVDVREFKTMHSLLAAGLVDERQVGTVRQHIVGVGNSAYVPLSIPARLEDEFQKIANKAAQIVDPFEQSLFLMTMISYVQFFVDVNKRTGRLMANVPLLKAGLSPLSFLNVDKAEYMRGLLSFYELGRADVIASAYAKGYVASASRYHAYIGRDRSEIELEARNRVELHRAVKEYVEGSLELGQKLGDDYYFQEFDGVVADDHDAFVVLLRKAISNLHDGNHVVYGIRRRAFDEYANLPAYGRSNTP
ncbi:Fic family protein [Thalassospira xiamenensis]|uniref:Fic/DOC family protein n=1 Tax=Thalassospira xiamenensis TaxID=220697 RepID=A0A285TIM5_9PROT|nr:Fic family protein [Thalassospira xiamenensis]SOC21598.1 Fic/DOC family protein [Thalassospira xiamenensis]